MQQHLDLSDDEAAALGALLTSTIDGAAIGGAVGAVGGLITTPPPRYGY